MSLPVRLLAPLETAPARISSALYVCSTCRRQCLPQALRSVNQFQFRQYHPSNSSQSNDNGDLPVTEKLRRKIWGTDKPPGVKDPYGSESQLDHVDPPVELSQADPLLESEMGEEDQGMRVATAEEKAHGEYKSADTWEGLRQVGAEQWWENPPRAEDYFEPFMALEKATSRTKFYQILHQAMVELLILKDMRKPLADGCNILGYEEAILSIINQAEVKMNDSTTPSLTFHGEEAKTAIYEWFAQLYEPIEGSAEAEAEETTVVAESSETQDITPEEEAQLAAAEQDEVDTIGPTTYRPKNLDFLRIPLTDSEFKFAYLKRVSQLTGYRIPDPQLAKITKPSRLLSFLTQVSKPKPKKLAEHLLKDERLTSLPNVKIMERRYTPIDKEKEIGRWKLIEEELTRRGLPVTGRVRT
ncbi:ribosomal subunit 39S superfamily domain-containing protein [Histoplasma ohiense]|nr:ribosomal subunit 39S superfamily domain-containing protein [Histoplasma ohiense (nom. inval.)]